MAIDYRYREPFFTHDVAENAWGKAYWAISGYTVLEWIRSGIRAGVGLDSHAMYDHRRFFNPVSKRCVCWCIKPKLGEIPEEITRTYELEVEEYPSGLTTENAKKEWKLQREWAHLYFKWDTMSVTPQDFNLLLAKILATADRDKLALAILDTKDLYVNYNPIEWEKKYNEPYPIEDLEKQKEIYTDWITYSGFKHLYLTVGKSFIVTPWYYRIPPAEDEEKVYGFSVQEYPNYEVHPLSVTGGLYYPPSYFNYNAENESDNESEDGETDV